MKKRTITAGICIISAIALSGCSMFESVSLKDAILSTVRSQQSKSLTEPGAAESKNYIQILGQSGAMDESAEAYFAYEMTDEPYDPGFYVQPDWQTAEYKYVPENGWQNPLASPFSTFAADVDTASYANIRRMILSGQGVIPDAVRIEEMINYFHYDYPDAQGNDPFSVTTEIAPCPWNEETQLMLIGLKARTIPEEERTPSNLVFLIDVSGSMEGSDRLGLIQRAFRLLVEELDGDDRVSIVTYANNDSVVLDGVHGDDKVTICEAIEDLFAGGGTNGSDGINTAYALAEKNFIKGGNNRILLATDGDLNIGITDEGSLTRLIKEKAESGVFLSALGVGTDNYSDANLEALADNGQGNYHYLDSISEARKVLVDEAGGTLFAVAKDVKLQVEFNPEKVKGYRLIGYENRTMAAEDFADDTKDGGEIGSGHTVTVLYEIASTDSSYQIPAVESKYSASGEKENPESRSGAYSDEWGTLHIRYKEPDGDTSTLTDTLIKEDSVVEEMSENMSWAAGVAQIGMLLKESEYAGTTDPEEVRNRLRKITKEDDFKEEFVYLIRNIGSDD